MTKNFGSITLSRKVNGGVFTPLWMVFRGALVISNEFLLFVSFWSWGSQEGRALGSLSTLTTTASFMFYILDFSHTLDSVCDIV